MEQIVGHKSMLLVVAAAAYILARLSQFGHSKSDAISFKVTSALLVLFLIAYLLRDPPYVRLVVTPKFPSVGRRKDNLWLVIQKNEKQTYWLNCYRPTT